MFFYDDGQWKIKACGRSCTLNVTTETIDTSVSGGGIWRTFLATANSFNGSFDGVVFLEEPGKITLPQLRQKQVSHEVIMFRMQRTDEGGNVYTDEGRIILTNSSDTGTYNDAATFAIDFVGTGALTQIFEITPVQNPNPDMRYEYTGGGGETAFEDAALIGKYILHVDKDGVGRSRIITSGTPVNKEVRYTSASGEFLFAQAFEPGEEAVVIYRDI